MNWRAFSIQIRFVVGFTVAFLIGGPLASICSAAEAAGGGAQKTILFIGDSLAAGYGVKKEESFPERVGVLLKARGRNVKIINGGISGSVSAEADRRVRWFLKAKPDVLVLELGGNDGLKGTPPAVIEKNLDQAIELALKNNIKVLLLGQRIYTSFGPDYTKRFEALYKSLATKHRVELVPFFLEPVAMKRELNQSDMKHPNALGHERVAEFIVGAVEKLL